MVQVIKGDTGWSDAFEQIGKGVSEGYMNRSDEMAIQNALSRLPENATMKQRLDAITGAKTYRPESKQNVIKNYLGQEQYDIQRKHYEKLEADRKAKEQETIIKKAQKDAEEAKKREGIKFLASKLDLPEEEKIALGENADAKTVEKLYSDQVKVTKGAKENAQEIRRLEKLKSTESALTTVHQMRKLRSKGNLGRGSDYRKFFGGEPAKDYGEYEQLGKSLISHATTIPIRNRLEFETLAEKLYDPSINDAEAEGTLNAMEKILTDALRDQETGLVETEIKDQRKPLDSFKKG